jgi:hypothetical protein
LANRPPITDRPIPAAIVLLAFLIGLSWQPIGAANDPLETIPQESAVRTLHVEPARIELGEGNREQQVLVTAETLDGKLFDVTHDCALSIADRQLARITDTSVQSISDGETELRVRWGRAEWSVPVIVRGAERFPPVHFGNDVVPILGKLGCNSGGCHGKASGQNGFKLSVFGFDPASDLDAIVKEGRGRRISPASPERSLFLVKPTAQVPHGGGKRLEVGTADYQVLLEWLRQGMPTGSEGAPQLVSIRVSPSDRVIGFGRDQQILTTAFYSDGSRRDVTAAASYTSNSDLVAEVNLSGLVHTGQVPGEAAVSVRYMDQVAAVQVQVPRPDGASTFPDVPANNRVDELVWSKLRKMGIVPSDLADDATFFRRLYIDTIGTLPKPGEVRVFLSDCSPDKRSRAIDAVLARDEFADYWAVKWADILLVDRKKLGERGAFEFHRWLRQQFVRNRPYDQWVRELITATGDTVRNGPANFYRALRTTEDVTKSVSQAFLGVRLECAQCHHHPFEKWGQSDFYGLAGFFNGLERKPIQADRPNTATDPGGPELIYHAGLRETRIPYFETRVETRPLGGWSAGNAGSAGASHHPGAERSMVAHTDPRVPLADWMTDRNNPWFARLAANRLFKNLLGRGLVEPEDDLRSTNPPTNGPLLDYLTEYLIERDFDFKALMRLILNSRVYQLSSVPTESNKDDTQNFSHYMVRRMPAEVLLDAISEVTGIPESFPGRPPGTRAIALWDNRLPSYFLEIFGRPERNSPCECGRSSEPTMAQALHLMNAPEVAEKVAHPAGRVAQLLESHASNQTIVNELCLAAVGRPARQREYSVAEKLFDGESRERAAQDFLWALLNSYEFLFVN